VRIISGKFKGKTIHPPKGFDARPTTDFAKTGLFNILGNHFDFSQINVLDLFAGTGSISFEFA
jgi:16S rRNA G966 N2-methylase RsmD